MCRDRRWFGHICMSGWEHVKICMHYGTMRIAPEEEKISRRGGTQTQSKRRAGKVGRGEM